MKSIFEAAEGTAALARLDFHAVALHFGSSAKFLSVLGIAARVAGAFSSSGASTGGAAAVASAGGGRSAGQQNLPPGLLTPKENSQNSQPQIVLQVIVHGSTYGGEAGVDEFIGHVTKAAEQRRINIVVAHDIHGNSLVK